MSNFKEEIQNKIIEKGFSKIEDQQVYSISNIAQKEIENFNHPVVVKFVEHQNGLCSLTAELSREELSEYGSNILSGCIVHISEKLDNFTKDTLLKCFLKEIDEKIEAVQVLNNKEIKISAPIRPQRRRP